ncbi:hypothetical protein G7067_08620 [Leucobacter insecticola]|uniref:DUF3137 domain-containing protein n=1 Tax=Leucobacter insecticola TaxID=2714934 RepID=A0A6G8FJB7_9MICO|nr:hypothetical protein [Leucobacter insecticola]QIM16467.1 hypothetical protein G7067_08620 [Leucobacter insecticola]
MAGITSLENFRRVAKLNAPVTRSVERRQNLGLGLLLGFLTPLFLLIGGLMVFIVLWSVDKPSDGTTSAASPTNALFGGLGAFLIAFLLIGAGVSILVKRKRAWLRHRAAAAMGQRHGWHFLLEQDLAEFEGTLFRVGANGIVEDALHIHEPRFAEVGNYSFAPSDRNNQRFEIGFVSLKLPRSLPHMYLASEKRSRKPRAFHLPFTSDQKLSLEGDFDNFFTLYCPREYERDALYVFTPDLMALMIDRADGYDIEILGEWLFIYAREPFDMTNEEVLEITETFNDTIGDLTERQTRRYVDDRTGDPWQVGAAGARLRDRRVLITALLVSAAGWIVGAAFVLIYAQTTGILDKLTG